jgi:hypothetical protein
MSTWEFDDKRMENARVIGDFRLGVRKLRFSNTTRKDRYYWYIMVKNMNVLVVIPGYATGTLISIANGYGETLEVAKLRAEEYLVALVEPVATEHINRIVEGPDV